MVKALKGAGLLKLGGGDAAPVAAKPVKSTRAKATKVIVVLWFECFSSSHLSVLASGVWLPVQVLGVPAGLHGI